MMDNKVTNIDVVTEKVEGLRKFFDERDRLRKEQVDEFNKLQKNYQDEIKGLTLKMWEEHNRALQLAIDKADISMESKLSSLNEFRQQQKDVIATFATIEKVDANIKSATERYESNVKVMDDKYHVLEKQLGDKIEQSVRIITEKFESVDKQNAMKTENVEVVMNKRFEDIMKDYIRPILAWKDYTQGTDAVRNKIYPIVVSFIMALVMFFLNRFIPR